MTRDARRSASRRILVVGARTCIPLELRTIIVFDRRAGIERVLLCNSTDNIELRTVSECAHGSCNNYIDKC